MYKKVKDILNMIKFEHTIFALPFAFIGAFIGSIITYGEIPSIYTIFWITVAMVGARSAAMALNRLIDRSIDAVNPRTANREIPAGKISVRDVLIFTVISFAILFFAAYQLNSLAIKLLPIAVFVLVLYSYTKRFTWLCHVVLGAAIGLAPLGGWVGATGTLPAEAWIIFVTVTLWTAGFDIIYACQDFEFDKMRKLHSIPVRFGIKKALLSARIMHGITAILLFSWLLVYPLSWWYAIGAFIANLILHYEHTLVKHDDLSKLNTAFFTMNGILSVVVFTFTLLDILL
ncbi:4-hydroxybenzoate octaprenyltransferase [Desulfuribacillus stibiiarsenatis]|uniref:4-hydroxybenzoate polyprenyltransferase n=1 Tax=Desulfuribacillus stibiiarsenatis TaxID=1390249 RepID=A0A1E5L6X4_9FIRM|nr:UbiA-like polyprenyltransferase [Desulfuribacillus stibiiarsenatis]OEH85907.1 4-hydroxybenzoate octaprenyltransferase [Desulfuribacillus stibiiarsenatis]